MIQNSLLASLTEVKKLPTTNERPTPKSPPIVRLAHVPGAQGDNVLKGRNGNNQLSREHWPSILISYFYIDVFLEQQEKFAYRDWMMDSGAFSAYNSGKSIDIERYIDTCLRLRQTDNSLAEIIALDVIDNSTSTIKSYTATGTSSDAKRRSGEASLKNALYMKSKGVEAMPVFHIGEDYNILLEYCKHYDKVGLSCRFGEPKTLSYKFYDQCFARIWPKKTHSFGWIEEKMLMTYPFHSSDSSSWEVGPVGFGNWKTFGKMSIKGSAQNLTTEVLWYLKLEERLRERWRKEMLLLESLPSVFKPHNGILESRSDSKARFSHPI